MRSPACAVIGDPVSHSLSPEIFAFLSRELGQPLTYGRLRLTQTQLEPTLLAVGKLGLFHGWNVTIPHKEAAARLAHQASPEVRAMGAANVLKFEGGKILAFNTDACGVEGTLLEHQAPVKGRDCLLLGAGGAARAAAFALGKLGAARVVVSNRGVKRARALCLDLGQLYPRTRFEVGAAGDFALIINSTPVGMQGYAAQGSLLPKTVRKGAWAFDLIYRPENTPFLRQARKRGLNTLGGLDMLVWQAIASWRIWFGPIGAARERKLKQALVKHLRNHLKGKKQ